MVLNDAVAVVVSIYVYKAVIAVVASETAFPPDAEVTTFCNSGTLQMKRFGLVVMDIFGDCNQVCLRPHSSSLKRM